MARNGARAYLEALGNLRCREPSHDAVQHLPLTSGEFQWLRRGYLALLSHEHPRFAGMINGMILGVFSISFHSSYSTQKPYTFPTPLYIIILTPHFYRKVGAPMCSPSPPATPDFKGAAQEQGSANIDAARAQGKLNNPNVYSPYGSQTVSYDGDQPTITQSFSPEQQAIYDQGNATKLQLSQLSGQGAQALQGVVGKQVDFGGAPSAPGDYSSMRNQTIDAMMARPKEDYARATDQAQSDLVAAGIRPGTKAYDDKMQLLQRGLNDANTQAAGNAGVLTSQAYQMDMDRRKQAITEQLAQRQIPLNEITALMSGSQVSNPFSTPGFAQNAQVGAAPVFAAQQAESQWGRDNNNADRAAMGNLQNGMFALGAAGISAMGGGGGGGKGGTTNNYY